MSKKDVVLAFSGGLDTSFCVPYLQEQGYAVHTVFADTGGVDADERAFIEASRRRTGRRHARDRRWRSGDLERIRQAVRLGGRGLPGPVSIAGVGSLPDRRSGAGALQGTGHATGRAWLHRNGQRPGALRPGSEGARRLHDHRADPRDPEGAHPDPRLRTEVSRGSRLRRARQAEGVHDQREPARADHVRRRDRSLGGAGRGRARLVRAACGVADAAAAGNPALRERRGGGAGWRSDAGAPDAGEAQRECSPPTASVAACTPATPPSA